MKKLNFDYHMHIAYSQEVEECYFTLKCLPPHTQRQQPGEIEFLVSPSRYWSRGEDSFGNQQILGRAEGGHRDFSFHVKGVVTTGIQNYEAEGTENQIAMYRYPHGLTCPGKGLLAYFRTIKPPQNHSPYEWAVALMHKLHQDFSYEKNVTDVTTTAEEAWNGKKGVCQDYAHIMITLCRLAGIPARYVTGMLIGEGYSHAWVEIFSHGLWYGLDPTNNIPVLDSHIKLGNGREASDCLINRGVIRGGGTQTQTISVKVEEICNGSDNSIANRQNGANHDKNNRISKDAGR